MKEGVVHLCWRKSIWHFFVGAKRSSIRFPNRFFHNFGTDHVVELKFWLRVLYTFTDPTSRTICIVKIKGIFSGPEFKSCIFHYTGLGLFLWPPGRLCIGCFIFSLWSGRSVNFIAWFLLLRQFSPPSPCVLLGYPSTLVLSFPEAAGTRRRQPPRPYRHRQRPPWPSLTSWELERCRAST